MKPNEYGKKMRLMEELHERGYTTSVTTGGFGVRRQCMATSGTINGCGYQVDYKATYEYPNEDVNVERIEEDCYEFQEKLSSIFNDMEISMYVGSPKT
jgi:hypothetical protein